MNLVPNIFMETNSSHLISTIELQQDADIGIQFLNISNFTLIEMILSWIDILQI